MNEITFSTIKGAEEIEILRDKLVFNYTYNQEEIDSLKKHFALKDSLYVLAKNKEKFAGFCSIDRNWWEDNYFFLRQILVDPAFRNLNIGSEVMNRCIDHAKKMGSTGVVTETAFENTPMQQLCKKFNFKEWANPQWKEGITYKIVF